MRFRMTNKHQRPVATCAKTRKGPKTLNLHNCSKTKKVPLLPILLICGYTGCRRKRGRVQYTLCLSRLPPPPSGPLALGGRCISSIAMPTDHSDVLCIICQSMCTCKRAWNVQSELQNGVIHVDMCYMCALAKHCLATTITWELCNFREHRQPTSCHSVALWQWQTSTQGLIRKMKDYSWIMCTKT